MHPELIRLQNDAGEVVALDTYSVMIITGFVIAMLLGRRQMRREGEDPGHITQLAFWVMFSGLIGGRLGFVLTGLAGGTAQISDLWGFSGGMVWYTGFIAATLTFVAYCWYSRINFFKVADLCIPYLAYAHAWGRLGCLAAGCCFGKPSAGALAVQFPVGSPVHASHVLQGLTVASLPPVPVHPTQLYEASVELLLFVALSWLRPHKRTHGQVFAAWLIAYAVLRFLVEMVRGDRARGVWAFGLSTSQWISMVVVAAGLALLGYVTRPTHS